MDLRDEITDVKYGEIRGSVGTIRFTFRAEQWEGLLRGRNESLCLGSSPEKDTAIAVRVLLDRDAKKINIDNLLPEDHAP